MAHKLSKFVDVLDALHTQLSWVNTISSRFSLSMNTGKAWPLRMQHVSIYTTSATASLPPFAVTHQRVTIKGKTPVAW